MGYIDTIRPDVERPSSNDGLIWPIDLQDEFLRQMKTGNPNNIQFKYTKFGLSIHNLYPEPVYLFYMGWLHNPFEDVIAHHEAEIKAGRWNEGDSNGKVRR